MKKIRVTIWNEFRHEKTKANVKAIYPNGIHATIGEFLAKNDDMEITLAALDDPNQGLPDEVLENTDVLIWWGHMAHGEVNDALVEKIRQRVYAGKMGFLPVHSGHHSKPFKAILGTTGNLSWGADQKEIIWNLNPTHRISLILRQEMAGFVAQGQVTGSRLSRTGVGVREDKKLPRPGFICPDGTSL